MVNNWNSLKNRITFQQQNRRDINMAAIPKQQIHDEIMAYIKSHKLGYNAWYVGVTSDISEGLFIKHNVSQKHDRWIYAEAASVDVAHEVAIFMITHYATEGSAGRPDRGNVFVYAYKITDDTIQ